MRENRHGAHTPTRPTAHLVWVTKYRHPVLQGDIEVRCKDLLVRICDAGDVRILKGVVSKEQVHMHIEYPPRTSLSDLVKRLQGRTSRRLQEEYPTPRKRYWVAASGPSGTGRGARATSATRRCRNILSATGTRRTGSVTRSPSNEAGLSVRAQPLHFPCIVV